MLAAFAVAPAAAQNASKPTILKDVNIEQKLGTTIPQDLLFRDETGKQVRLGDYFHSGRPVILSLVYYECPMLCNMVLNDITRSINGISNLSVGEQFDIVTVSFDPKEGPDLAYKKKEHYLREYRRPHAEEGWHFLTGSQESIKQLTDAVGFRYAWDAKYQQFAHASGIMIASPEGKLTRYFFGIDYAPADLRLSLEEATGGKITTAGDQVLLYCFHYDPSTGRYSLMVGRMLQLAGGFTVLFLGTFLWMGFRRDRRRPAGV